MVDSWSIHQHDGPGPEKDLRSDIAEHGRFNRFDEKQKRYLESLVAGQGEENGRQNT